MTTPTAIRWFKQTFGAQITRAVSGTPFTVDFLVAIACQETGAIWQPLQRKGVATADILRLCTGDTMDGTANRRRTAFPRDRAELEAHAQGEAMFAIARRALEEMAEATQNEASVRAARNSNKFCRSFGVFRYDLRHFLTNPDYFLRRRYEHFDEAVACCIAELWAAKRSLYPRKKALTDLELLHVGIVRNTGEFNPARGLRQGYRDADGVHYGEQLQKLLQKVHKNNPQPAGETPVEAKQAGDSNAASGSLDDAVPASPVTNGGASARNASRGDGQPQPRAAGLKSAGALHAERLSLAGNAVPACIVDLEGDLIRLGLDAAAIGDVVAVDVGALSRGSGRATEVDLAHDDLVAVKLASGATLWFTPEDFLDWEGVKVARPRDGVALMVTPSADGSRAGGWLIKAVSFIARRLLDPLFNEVSNLVERALVARLESKLVAAERLFRVDRDGKLGPLGALKADARWLLFLHGTQSSSIGSFARLWQSGAFRQSALHSDYAGILAFEHRTLSASPVTNLEALATQLPKGARLVVVGYSRGGLLGDLLTRACPSGGDSGVDDEGLADFRRYLEVEAALDNADGATAKAALDGIDAEVASLRNAAKILRDKRIVVEWFVPVGAPLAGTTLASGKLSRLLSQLTNLIGVAQLPGAELLSMQTVLIKLLAAVARDIVDFRDLPGLQSMNPGGALISWLARGRGRGLVSALKCRASRDEWRVLVSFALDRLFECDNDWVVDTASMVPPPRTESGEGSLDMVFALDVSAAGVNHLSYFANERVQQVLTRMLACPSDGQRALMETLKFSEVKAPRTRAPVARAARIENPPILFILPGIMGTGLAVGTDRVWLDKLQLLFGGMNKLAIGAANVTTSGPLEDEYGDLIAHFSQTHEVVAFGYDWRQSLASAAQRLNESVRSVLAKSGTRPISFLAHSMGGLVVRTMMALPDSAWNIVGKNPQSRFVMLGTPNAGSHAISQILTGEERLLKLLAIGPSDLDEIVGYCAAYPGVLDMLPEYSSDEQMTPGDGFFEQNFWRTLLASAGRDLPLPRVSDLSEALKTRRMLRAQMLPRDKVFYVAGTRDETPVDVQLKPHWFGRQRIVFVPTACGDGRVTWAHGIPKDIRHWFVNTIHGDLSSDRNLFSGYADILATGDTRERRFASTQPLRSLRDPASRGPGADTAPFMRSEAAVLPNQTELTRAGVGGFLDDSASGARPIIPRINVSVCCGDVRSARYPVMVGHYRDDGLHSAEFALNHLVNGALQRSLDFGTHPREIRENKIFEVKPSAQQVRRAIVVGLGEFGLLSAGRLVDTLAQAITCWIEFNWRNGDTQPASLSTVLIGTGTGGIGVEPALQALLEAVISATNRFAGEHHHSAWPLEIEIVERYSDRAYRAWHTLGRLIERSKRLVERFDLAPRLRSAGTGLRRAYYEEDNSWAQRVRVTGGSDEHGRDRLTFEVYSALARVSAQQVDVNRAMTQSLIAPASQHGSESPDVSVALYNLLVPREIKEARPNGERLVLIVDEPAAGIPWELLRPSLRGDGNEPLSIQGGMVRQLSLPDPPVPLRRVRDRRALVIADPAIGDAWSSYFSPLAGARREGAEVKSLLHAARYDVNEDEPRNCRDITEALFKQSYQIMHIAAHGVFEWIEPLSNKPLTGAVMDGMLFRPDDVGRLPGMPELVFINCCHLGRVGRDGTNYPRLAANLARSFIELGARAVVAAGWAVNDGAALLFARVFYEQMLNGAAFIDAVRGARIAAYEAYPGDNTWGAYQCYGVDSYTLTDAMSATSAPGKIRYCTTHDLILSTINPAAGIVRLARNAQVEDNVAALHATLALTPFGVAVTEAFDRAADPAGSQAGSALPHAMHVALSDFYWYAGMFAPAAWHAHVAWKANQFTVNTRMLTRFVDAASRKAMLVEDVRESQRWMARAIKELNQLRALPATPKRFGTIASVLRRAALVEPTLEAIGVAECALAEAIRQRLDELGAEPDDKLTARWLKLALAAQGTERARWMSVEHVVNNRVGMLIVRCWMGHGGKSCHTELRAFGKARWQSLRRGRFWRIAARADRLLLQTIVAHMLGFEPPVAEPAARYARALDDGLMRDPGREKISSVRETLDALESFVPPNDPAVALLQQFRREFDARMV